MKIQRFKDGEICNLYVHMSKYILPRLKRFSEIGIDSHPSDVTMVEWILILDDMIKAFEIMSNDDNVLFNINDEHSRTIKIGLDLFAKYYVYLWY